MLAERVKQWAHEWQQQGLAKGLETGLEQGREQGQQQGRQKEAARLFELLLQAKFGSVGEPVLAQIRAASPEQIEIWAQRIFLAQTAEEVLKA